MSDTSAVITVTDQSFDTDVIAASHERPVVVDFWAAWCAPCRALGPIIETAVEAHGGVTLAKLDTDANQITAARFGIQGIPAVKAFRDGQVVSEFVGAQPRRAVEAFLAALVPPAALSQPLPTDEVGLRALLDENADHVAARRALGRLLLDGDALDEADAVLAIAPADPVCDGLRARIEMRRASDPTLKALLGDGNEALALDGLIAAVRNSSGDTRARLRRIAVGIIEAERERNPAVEALRADLASALY